MSIKQNAVIIAAGELGKIEYMPHESDYIIAADRGYLYAENLGVKPDCVIGDFDSLGRIPNHDNLTVLPCEKDDTDTSFAVKRALEMGFKKIFILGGLGGRFDHTFANVQLLAYIARNNAVGFLVGEREVMTVIKDSTVTLYGESGQILSLFSLTEKSYGVCEKGFKYELENAELESCSVLGTSNELLEKKAEISVKKGELLICAKSLKSDFIYQNRDRKEDINEKLNVYF
ncbi:MAG: thiamine diphosphokinase [Ruminococcaceae bacterium]|nr:thiamine diphosphokinase [Oscillospiraceae bacterium]